MTTPSKLKPPHHPAPGSQVSIMKWCSVTKILASPHCNCCSDVSIKSFKHVQAPLGHRLASLERYILPAAVETLPAHARGFPLRCGSCLGKIHPNVILRLRSDRHLTVGDVYSIFKWVFIHLGGQELAHEEYSKINSIHILSTFQSLVIQGILKNSLQLKASTPHFLGGQPIQPCSRQGTVAFS